MLENEIGRRKQFFTVMSSKAEAFPWGYFTSDRKALESDTGEPTLPYSSSLYMEARSFRAKVESGDVKVQETGK